VTKGDPLADGELRTIDVRDLKPQRRHNVLLEIFDELEPNEGFVPPTITIRSRCTTSSSRCTAT